MVTISSTEKIEIQPDEYLILVEMRGLSTDNKPTEYKGKKIENGSTFIEIDTGNIYFYDLENEQWKKV